ncbi:hypothetical protein LSAT2_028288, partial [Lamellibrachia satsuma]
RRNATDAKAILNTGLNIDHRPVILCARTPSLRTPRSKIKISKVQINLWKLQKEEIQQEVEIEVTKKLKDVNNTKLTAEETWSVFKNTLVEALKEACGTWKTGQTKQTAWWNNTVKEGIREKKKLSKVWVKTKLEKDYIKYRIARQHSKRVVKTAKESSWKAYGEELSELCKHSPRELYKSGKAMRLRNKIYNPTTVIHNKDG